MATSPSRQPGADPSASPHSSRPDASAPAASGHTLVNQHRLYWEVYGASPVPDLILLHQGLGSVGDWRHQLGYFSQRGCTVLAYDRWGYGRSDPRESFSDDFQDSDAEEAATLLRSLGIQGANIIGHSDGGSIAVILAAEHPQLVRRLVLVAPHVYLDPINNGTLQSLPRHLQAHPKHRSLRRAHSEKAAKLYSAWLDCWIRPARATFNIKHQLAKIACPTLVIAGQDDPYFSNDHARLVAAGIEGAELWLIPGVGHLPPLEMPKRFNQRVFSFLEECG